MRSLHVALLVAGLALAAPRAVVAQDLDQLTAAAQGDKPTRTVTTAKGDTYTVMLDDQAKPAAKPRMETVPDPAAGRWVKTLTNVQVELTITDQTGTAVPEKKTVSMVVSSGSWGRIRSAATMFTPGNPPIGVDLNVDARPFVATDGPVQLELTIAYSPLGSAKEDGKGKPPTVNQSLTVILQSGKPLVISQAADPVGDRKIIVEAKATVLK